jgi:uncharacterized protein YndB with AHSA1/START domain
MSAAIHHTVQLRCSVEHAFRLFTLSEYIETWLALEANVEPHVGGRYELFWDPDKNYNNTGGCRVTAFVPNTLVGFEWKGSAPYADIMNTADPLTQVVVFFRNSRDKAFSVSEVHLIHSGWRNTPEWIKARDFYDRAWRDELVELRRIING